MEFLIFDAAPPTNVRKGGRPWFPTGGPPRSLTISPCLAASKRIVVACSGAIAMCLDAAENPMMYVPWWTDIG